MSSSSSSRRCGCACASRCGGGGGTYLVDGLERRAGIEQRLHDVRFARCCGGYECRVAALRCEARRRRRRRGGGRRRRSSSRTTTTTTMSSAERTRGAREVESAHERSGQRRKPFRGTTAAAARGSSRKWGSNVKRKGREDKRGATSETGRCDGAEVRNHAAAVKRHRDVMAHLRR